MKRWGGDQLIWVGIEISASVDIAAELLICLCIMSEQISEKMFKFKKKMQPRYQVYNPSMGLITHL